jgi:hypothetical protein
VAPREQQRPLLQSGVRRLAGALAPLEAFQHPGDPRALVRLGESGREQHHYSVTVAIRRHRSAASPTAAHLDPHWSLR